MKTIITALLLTLAASTALAGGNCGSHGSSYRVQSYSYQPTYRAPQRVEVHEAHVEDNFDGEVVIYRSKGHKQGGLGLATEQTTLKKPQVQKQGGLPLAAQSQKLGPLQATAVQTTPVQAKPSPFTQTKRPVIQGQKIQSVGQGAVVPLQPNLLLEIEASEQEPVAPGAELEVDPQLLERPELLDVPQLLDGPPAE